MIYIILFLLQHYRFLINVNILQKQYYELNRFILYYKQNKRLIIFKTSIFLSSILLSLFHPYFIFLFILFFIDKFKNKIVKLKISNRIKRMFLIFEILNILSIYLAYKINIAPITILLVFVTFYITYFISFIIESILQKINIKKAKNKLKLYNTKIVAITGSYGKTSCKNYTKTLIDSTYNTLISPMSYNTLNGLLITINTYLKPYHEVLIVEIGVDRKNGMNKFLKHFKFDICLVTCIGNQHLKTFKNIENIAKEKTKLFNNATNYIILNNDDEFLKNIPSKVNKISFSNINKSDIEVSIIKENISSTSLKINIFDQTYFANTKLIGRHNINNIACCIAIAKALNIKDECIIQNISKLKNVEHRLSIINKNNWTIIDDSYNSNYVGFINALNVLKKANNIKVLITPGIIENNTLDNQKLANTIITNTDLILLINNPPFAKYIDEYLSFLSFKEAYTYLEKNYADKSLTILIENDLPDIFIR